MQARSALLIALAALFLGGCGKSNVIEKGIVLKGHGEVKVMPDVAEIRLSIITKDLTNSGPKATEANARKTDAVRRALASAGVKPGDVTTISFDAQSVQPYQYYPVERPVGKRYYQVSNRLLVTARDTKLLGKLVDASVKAGATSVDSVDYRFSNLAGARAEALANAVRNAKVRAQAAARAGGVRLLPISQVTQEGVEPRTGWNNYYSPVKMDSRGVARKKAPMTYAAPREETISEDVVVTFAVQRG
jgi:uncharacterized protein YggE